MGPVDSSDWGDFEMRSRFVYSCLLGKINTDMHEKGARISNQNGYKLYRNIYNSVDAIPANAEFTYDQALMQLVPMYAGKVENPKELYEFRVVLKNKVNPYTKRNRTVTISQTIEGHAISCMDVNSKQVIRSAGVDNHKCDPRDEARGRHV